MRFVNFFERDFFSIIYNFSCNYINDYIFKIKEAKWNNFKWKGLTLMKDPMSISIYMQILQDIKPKTIIEFGTYEGGSSLWMSDLMNSLGENCKIYTFDIDESKVKIPKTSDIFFYHLDVFNIKNFTEKNKNIFESLEHPVIVIEDCHENVLEVLTTIDKFLEKNDYLIVEDTIDKNKHDILQKYLEKNNYAVDSYYCDFWGYNNSWNFNSILRKN